jgi:hypothetical protein
MVYRLAAGKRCDPVDGLYYGLAYPMLPWREAFLYRSRALGDVYENYMYTWAWT